MGLPILSCTLWLKGGCKEDCWLWRNGQYWQCLVYKEDHTSGERELCRVHKSANEILVETIKKVWNSKRRVGIAHFQSELRKWCQEETYQWEWIQVLQMLNESCPYSYSNVPASLMSRCGVILRGSREIFGIETHAGILGMVQIRKWKTVIYHSISYSVLRI